MKLHRAWIHQAESDLQTAQRAAGAQVAPCQIVAKCQQSVEKSVKALVESLAAIGLTNLSTGSGHSVHSFAMSLSAAVQAAPRQHRWLKVEVARLYSRTRLAGVASLDAVVPRYPAKGGLAVRNTEYPFNVTAQDWTAPADAGVFSGGETKRMLHVASALVGGTHKILAALERLHPALR